MTDRNRKLVPDNWSLVRERVLTTVLCTEGRYFDSEPSGCLQKSGAAWKVCKILPSPPGRRGQ